MTMQFYLTDKQDSNGITSSIQSKPGSKVNEGILHIPHTPRPEPLYQIQFSIIIFTQPLRSGRIWHKVIFKRSLTGLDSEFSFS